MMSWAGRVGHAQRVRLLGDGHHSFWQGALLHRVSSGAENDVVISFLLYNVNAPIKSSVSILCLNMRSIILTYELKFVRHLIQLQIGNRGPLIVIKFILREIALSHK
jgi:hypothetical protein